ncbi:hypothetical protein COJ50_23975 [Bacillus cereus]|uniref:ABC transporter domain-containing protein n=1 Tax=Bacillus cereus TaxID=1396 RepID=A0A2A8R7T6_BACCE|nr:hypothetical protein CN450_15950 [Bacillus cereus]PFN19340.1 hypothetical protein COJ50_23975 [Bacillus cereus]
MTILLFITSVFYMKLVTEEGFQNKSKHILYIQLSGEQQRVAIARALSYNVDLLMADEPTAHTLYYFYSLTQISDIP